tara:strand:+ start:1437 stop:1742 length:306 start_codon:yes stop_codon:yes gene_type:complete
MRWLALLAVLVLAGCTAPPVAAQIPLVQCLDDRAAMVDQLWEKYSEFLVGRGKHNRANTTIEIFSTKDGSTWSLVITQPNGRVCLVVEGKDWERPPRGQGH